MRAAIYKETGIATDVLRISSLDTPTPGANEVLVKISASGVNPTDTRTRAGIFPIHGEWERIVPHHDGAGIIEKVGDGLSSNRIGERVWLHSTQWGGNDGTAAEFAIVKNDHAITLPSHIDFSAGATFGVPLLTAYHAVTMDGPVTGKTLLVQGGAGAVGNYAVQIARQMGAAVITTVSSAAKADSAVSAGAHHVINYRNEDLVQRVKDITNGHGVDHIVEVNLSANATQLPELLKNGGFVAVYGAEQFIGDFPIVGAIVQQLRLGFFVVFMLPQDVLATAIKDLTGMLESGSISASIHSQLPLDQIALAHDLVDSNKTIGNVVIRLD